VPRRYVSFGIRGPADPCPVLSDLGEFSKIGQQSVPVYLRMLNHEVSTEYPSAAATMPAFRAGAKLARRAEL
jgi:hypothetical protein